MNKISILSLALIFLYSCNNGGSKYDASGTFETDEIIVSAEATGKILQFNIEEGDALKKESVIGQIDVVNLELQKVRLRPVYRRWTRKQMTLAHK